MLRQEHTFDIQTSQSKALPSLPPRRALAPRKLHFSAFNTPGPSFKQLGPTLLKRPPKLFKQPDLKLYPCPALHGLALRCLAFPMNVQ